MFRTRDPLTFHREVLVLRLVLAAAVGGTGHRHANRKVLADSSPTLTSLRTYIRKDIIKHRARKM